MDFTNTWTFHSATAAPVPPLLGVGGEATGASITVRLAAPARVQVTVLDLGGRRVAVLPEVALGKGLNVLVWDGRTAMGRNAGGKRHLARVLARGEDGVLRQGVAVLQ